MGKQIATPELIERAKALDAVGWAKRRIAKELNVSEKTIRRWLLKDDPPGMEDALAAIRSEHAQRYVNEAWALIWKLNAIVEAKIAEGPDAFPTVKDAATTMGQYFDRILSLESRGRKGSGQGQTAIQINILPPGGNSGGEMNGNSPRVVANAVQLHDESEEVFSDGGGSGSGEDVLRLPAGREDGS